MRLTAAALKVSQELASPLCVHAGKTFYDALIAFITYAVMAMVWETGTRLPLSGENGKNTRTEAATGTIRHDYALQARFNITHVSDSPENAEAELLCGLSRKKLLLVPRYREMIYE